MPTTATHTFTPGGLLPATPDPRNSTYSAKLKASTAFQQGSLLAELTATPGVYVPYVARPIRGEILALREKEFIEAAVAQGKGPLRIMFSELMPNIVSTVVVFFTLNIANNMHQPNEIIRLESVRFVGSKDRTKYSDLR